MPQLINQADITAASIICNSPHLVDAIMRHATDPTLAVCLRVNEAFHAAAGKALYHTVRVDGVNMFDVFRGALVGKDWSDDTEEQDWEVVRARKAIMDSMKSPPPHRNFKAPLLNYTRVLSLGSHEYADCCGYDPHIASLLPNVHTLRIVPRMDYLDRPLWKLDWLCDAGGATYVIFWNLAPRKIVLRNMNERSWHRLGWPGACFDDWNTEQLEEVVWVMHSSGDHYNSGDIPELLDEGPEGYFNNDKVARVKVTFHDEWETWDPPRVNKNEKNEKPAKERGHHFADNIIFTVGDLCWNSDIHNTVYGLEDLQFKPGADWLEAHFTTFFPHVRLTSDRLRELVRDELRSGALRATVNTDRYEDNGKPECIEYKTLAEYHAQPESARLYELDDGLEWYSV
ncbi:uncharacterized protein LOC62_01G001632 [Vanrija pseudolonga]|uniref:Uncharacterized protein n=1 Tax=Vanrija pseudolonga TaxID=143232 RepID=A0AAF0Y4G3_9TREE|nr:hypothetical protein LOC62_01G001632 [Vanrija pseudolonga]